MQPNMALTMIKLVTHLKKELGQNAICRVRVKPHNFWNVSMTNPNKQHKLHATTVFANMRRKIYEYH